MKRKVQSKKRSMMFIMFVMVMLAGVGFIQVSNAYFENQEREKEVATLEAEIKKEQVLQLELLKTKEEMTTRQFIEDTARSRFGMIYPGEIIIDTTEAE